MTTAYYANINPELLRWMPLSARDVLEVGCGEGALAAAYKRRNPTARYTAVEAHAPAAAVASARVDRLLAADFEGLSDAEFDELGAFDLVVMGDVLEHLADPWRALRRLKGLLRPEGRLALSVPNAGHWSLLSEVMSGRWPAHDSGLFDRTHLRWFTLQSLGDMLASEGYAMERARPRLILLDRDKAAAWIPPLAAAAAQAGVDAKAFEQRAQTLQWVVNARPADATGYERLHLHFAAITPDFLDVRMRLPAEAMQSDPSLSVSYVEKDARLPDLPLDLPKVAVVQRLALTDPSAVQRYVERAEAGGWVLVFEIDDHPDLIGQVQRSDVGRRLDWTLRGFHAVQTSTGPLGEALRLRHPELAVFPNALLEPPPPPPPHEGVRVFHGALNREGFTRRVASQLGAEAKRLQEAEFVVVHDRAFFDALPAEANKTFHKAASYADYLALMARCDIVLSPLEGSPSELFKSDVKFLEAGSVGAAVIASPAVYADTIEDGATGLIAASLDDWPRLFDHVVGASDLRARLGRAARRYVDAERRLAPRIASRGAWYRSLWRDRTRLRDAARERIAADG